MKSLILLAIITLLLAVGVSAECVDTDDGRNWGVKGVTTYTKDGREISTTPDQCLDEIRLEEYFCDSDGKTGVERYDCLEGCEDGACIGMEEPAKMPEEEVIEEEEETADIPQQETPLEEPEIPSKAGYTNVWTMVIIAVIIIAAVTIFFKKKGKVTEEKKDIKEEKETKKVKKK